MPMTCSTRLFNCLRCHHQVRVCQSCDHGQRYCGEDCRQIARMKSLKRSNQKYQKSRKGRFNNAYRQRRFRQRKKEKTQKVTDQSSPSKQSCDLLISKTCWSKKRLKNRLKHEQSQCHFCGKPCGSFYRLGFLKKRTVYPYIRRVKNSL